MYNESEYKEITSDIVSHVLDILLIKASAHVEPWTPEKFAAPASAAGVAIFQRVNGALSVTLDMETMRRVTVYLMTVRNFGGDPFTKKVQARFTVAMISIVIMGDAWPKIEAKRKAESVDGTTRWTETEVELMPVGEVEIEAARRSGPEPL